MNETTGSIVWIVICCIIAVVLFCAFEFFRKRRTDSDSERIEELNGRAGENNRSLEEKERRTRELIEESRAETERARDLIEGQGDDYRRAEENNRRTKELIGKAEKILNPDLADK